MPYKFESDKKMIPKEFDKRIKLTHEDKKQIKKMYIGGGYSQRELARLFKVSRRTIQFIINPESLKANLQRRKEHGGSMQYYDKDKNKQYKKIHRDYKKELDHKGLLK